MKLKKLEIAELLKENAKLNHWKIIDNHHLEKSYFFANFAEALDFTNKVAKFSESMNHHPDIYLAWGKVKLTIWTHTVDGITNKDFEWAKNIDLIV